MTDRPTCRNGDFGSEVMLIQQCLRCDQDGDFGRATHYAVEDFQRSKGLAVDGVVGPDTWKALDHAHKLPAYPPKPLPVLRTPAYLEIKQIAEDSDIAGYNWRDRGQAPLGYIQGMAFAYSVVYRKFLDDDQPARFLAKARDGQHSSTDALDWYQEEMREHGWDNLRIGLGMRESSGVYCEGRDQSATNTSSDTCEAGLFQTSWNASACSTDFERLLDEYSAIGENHQQTALELFSNEVSCGSADWDCYGSGQGFAYQQLAKHCPQFAVETTACGLRYLRQHWGPIGRKEVEIRREADDMLRQVQDIID
jgi:hypothetical protein